MESTIIRFPGPLSGSVALNTSGGGINLAIGTRWEHPLGPASGSASSSEFRWATSWGVGTYDGAFGVRSRINFDSRVLIEGAQDLESTGSPEAISRFRPANV